MTGPFFRSLLGAVLLVTIPVLAVALPQKGQPAPPFQVTSTSGQKIVNANYRGYVLLLDFFASWCGPCRESTPALVKLTRKYGGQGFQVLA